MDALAIRKTNHKASVRQSVIAQLVDCFGFPAPGDIRTNQQVDYSALNHYLDRQPIDTAGALNSTECNCPVRYWRWFFLPVRFTARQT
jgi:hypothetical protein